MDYITVKPTKLYLLVILAVLLIAVPVMAATFEARITVIESDGNSYDMLGMGANVSISAMVTGGYITATGTDVQIMRGATELPRMLTDDTSTGHGACFADSVTADSSTTYTFETGNTAENFDIIPLYGGLFTVTDHATIEPSANFTIELNDAWINTDNASEKYLFDHYDVGGIRCSVSPTVSGTITASILSTQVIVGGYNDALSSAATEYNALMGGGQWNVTEVANYQVMPTDGTLGSLYVRLSANVGAGGTYTFTIIKNGVAQSLAVTLSAGESTGSDQYNTVSFVAGDTVSIRSTYTGAPGNPTAAWSTKWGGDTTDETIFMVNVLSDSAATTYYDTQGISQSRTGTETRVQAPLPTNGTFKSMYVKLSADPGNAPDAYSFTLRKAGGDTALTTTITADDTTGSDLVNTVALVAGDLIDYEVTPLNAPAASGYCAISMVFVPDTLGESVIIGGAYDQPSQAAAEYNHLCGTDGMLWNNTEASVYSLLQSSTLKDLYVILDAAPDNGAGVQSYTVSIRSAAGDTGLTTTISEASTAGNDTVNTFNTSNGATADIKSVPANTPVLARIHIGLVSYIPSVSVSATSVASGEYDITVESPRSLYFDASDDNVAVPTAAIISDIFDGGGTVIFWMKPDSDGENSRGRVFEKGANNVSLKNEAGGFCVLAFQQQFDGTNYQTKTATANITIGDWEHVAVTYNNDNIANRVIFYINTNVKAEAIDLAPVGTRTSDVAQVLYIGDDNPAGGGSTSGFDGDIGGLWFYDTILTPAQITDHFNGIYDSTNLVAHWNFDEDSGTTAYDTSNNSNDGTINNATWDGDRRFQILLDATLDDTSFPIVNTSVPDSNADWTFMKNDVNDFFPYCGNITIEIDGVLQAWYEPDDIIAGDVLPDRQGTAQDGTFTWGTNPSGISVVFSSMELVEDVAAPPAGLVTPDALGIVRIDDPIHRPDADLRMPAHELYPIVRDVASFSNITEEMIWWFISAFLALLALAATRKWTNSTMFAGFCCCAVMGIFISMAGGCLEWWMPAPVLLATFTTVIWNRTPAL